MRFKVLSIFPDPISTKYPRIFYSEATCTRVPVPKGNVDIDISEVSAWGCGNVKASQPKQQMFLFFSHFLQLLPFFCIITSAIVHRMTNQSPACWNLHSPLSLQQIPPQIRNHTNQFKFCSSTNPANITETELTFLQTPFPPHIPRQNAVFQVDTLRSHRTFAHPPPSSTQSLTALSSSPMWRIANC